MADTILEWAVDRLLAVPTIAQKTNGRVYTKFVAELGEVVYPVLTIARSSPGSQDLTVPLADFDLQVSAWAETYDESYALFQAAATSLNRVAGTVTGLIWLIAQSTTPITMADDDSRKVYQTTALFRVRSGG